MTLKRALLREVARFSRRVPVLKDRLRPRRERPPLRAELLNVDQLTALARTLAQQHVTTTAGEPKRLLRRLDDNETMLEEVHLLLLEAFDAKQPITPAGEWLLDNHERIAEQIQIARRHFPKGYSVGLPRLASGPNQGLPRIYDLALQLISHGDGHVSEYALKRAVRSYQTVSVLTLGELWAVPIMLRLALIENLRRVAARVRTGRLSRAAAQHWSESMIDTAERDPKSLIMVVADMARSEPRLDAPFVAEMVRRLQGQGATLALPLSWIEQRLAENGESTEKNIAASFHDQAANQLSVSNTIGTLRDLGQIDWHRFVESTSPVDETLRNDPAEAYAAMDFVSRDHYRHAVERLARRSRRTELEVAREAVALAQAPAPAPDDELPVRRHVGFYLIDNGLPELEARLEIRSPISFARWARRHPLRTYLGLAGTLALLYLVIVAAAASRTDGAWSGTGAVVAVTVLGLLAAFELAVGLSHWLLAIWLPPRVVARLDYDAGISPSARTLIAIPTLLTSADGVREMTRRLEVHYLANRDTELRFALLTDFADAPAAELPTDAALLAAATAAIEGLNERYRVGTPSDLGAGPAPVVVADDPDETRSPLTGPISPSEADGARFYLLHRPRQYNAGEGVWMGRERKRGKLGDLNRLLLRGDDSAFATVVGDRERLRDVRYVITLDSDTKLPREAARSFVGAMMHPLNRPVFDAARRHVVRGYGILQPRVSSGLEGANRSRYAWLHGGSGGLDPYTRLVSNLYQDLFGEGSFVGKGIYEVAAFEQALDGRLPENRILSHDLLEGAYARSGLLSDAELVEDYPGEYLADADRRHRWVRGDWQVAAWTRGRSPDGAGKPERNTLATVSRWKLFDNLRRSFSPALLVALLLAAWFATPVPGLITLAVVGVLLIPAAASAFDALVRAPRYWRLHLESLRASLLGVGFNLAVLPFETVQNLDAVARTLWRLGVSRRHLLQWRPSGAASRHDPTAFATVLRRLWIAPAFALGTAALLLGLTAALPPAAWPVLLLWLLAPGIAWYASQPIAHEHTELDAGERLRLRKLARRTWHFFETFVTEEDHWLPPDNVQEHPVQTVAHRTSPTNIGLSLLATVSAHDSGYISQGRMIYRTALTLDSMLKLERHRGHFYNWYDTLTLAALRPIYLSTVDSGNLAGSLLILRAALDELAAAPIVPACWHHGLEDVLSQIEEHQLVGAAAAHFEKFRAVLGEAVKPEERRHLGHLRSHWLSLNNVAQKLAEATDHYEKSELVIWCDVLWNQCRALLRDLDWLLPVLRVTGGEEAVEDAPYFDCSLSLEGVVALDALVPETVANDAQRDRIRAALAEGRQRAERRLAEIARCGELADDFARVDYGFLYHEKKKTLSIGYDLEAHRLDLNSYDLLASEARLASFLAVASGQVPQKSWFALGRGLTPGRAPHSLASWSGTMFEYLMPQLLMPNYPNTLIDMACRAAVTIQRRYGEQRGTPWGISESGFNAVDAAQNYQYHAFGVPALGIRKDLGEDLVIAPYASMMALVVNPAAAIANLDRLQGLGMRSRYGFYEALDFTPTRMLRDRKPVVVKSYMAHHQGMGLLAMDSVLHGQRMQRRFAQSPQVAATLLLLQERIPHLDAPRTARVQREKERSFGAVTNPVRMIFGTAPTATPQVQLLSNGRYHVMLTSAGGGYSHMRQLALTRWREDPTTDALGLFCYVRDVESGATWSSTLSPAAAVPDRYQATLGGTSVEYRRLDHGIETHTEAVVSPEDDIELRRVRLTNRSKDERVLELTTYAEVVLTTPAADAAHPGFSNLFVETEILPEQEAILCTRRPRATSEKPPYLLHLLTVREHPTEATSFETDRMRFIGRARGLEAPAALDAAGPLSNTAGSVLNPVVSARQRVRIPPGKSVTLDCFLGYSPDREGALALVEKYRDRRLASRVSALAWTHHQVSLRQLDVSDAEAELFEAMAGAIVFPVAEFRAQAATVAANTRGQSSLWGYSISGDLPIVLVKIRDVANLGLIRQLVKAHAYWRSRGLPVDLVIWNEEQAGYRQVLNDQIHALIALPPEAGPGERASRIYLRNAEFIAPEDRILQLAVARIVLTDAQGSLAEQMTRRLLDAAAPPALVPTRRITPESYVNVTAEFSRAAQLGNGIGGFSADGTEYVIQSHSGQRTPLPWSNVIANPHFGTVVSESGSAYTWGVNAHELRLTPWHNDPVTDSSGEASYLRDEETGQVWSPAPLPYPTPMPYATRHGFGYTVYEHLNRGIQSELWVYVALDASVKFTVLRVRNITNRPRKLSFTTYAQWVLGDHPHKCGPHVVTELDTETEAVFARNAYTPDFGNQVAFAWLGGGESSRTGDRTEFLGRMGSLRNPAGMKSAQLSGSLGAALDPCAALRGTVEVQPGQVQEIVGLLGLGGSATHAREMVRKYRGTLAARAALDAVRHYWRHTLDAVQVKSGDPAVDVMVNGWLPYQTIACRIMARSGASQSGGAFGYRDQLQDCMAVVHHDPKFLRDQLLLSASRQFVEGDVQHWWHPPSGRGVRTLCSDDYLWLPLGTSRYVETTGDAAILDEVVPFLEGRELPPHEESVYDLPQVSAQTASLYEHCKRAVRRVPFGEHGLPLMGAGDWNDGMNRVGIEGKGESVWLAWFYVQVLDRFAPIARSRGDDAFAEECDGLKADLLASIEAHGWDGGWYRRAYCDDGSILGSADNVECRIDSIAQSWSVLATAHPGERAPVAMQALYDHLVRKDSKVIQLLDPPFNGASTDPGYIRGYAPGVRENGGQYTHAAIWAAMAFAELGDNTRAWELANRINPVNHARTQADAAIYMAEPYVLAADVYAVAPHIGRGGWTWYTGSAGWMLRLLLESLLGVVRQGNTLSFRPVPAPNQAAYEVSYRAGRALYRVRGTAFGSGGNGGGNANGEGAALAASLTLDGKPCEGLRFELRDDGREHVAELRCGSG